MNWVDRWGLTPKQIREEEAAEMAAEEKKRLAAQRAKAQSEYSDILRDERAMADPKYEEVQGMTSDIRGGDTMIDNPLHRQRALEMLGDTPIDVQGYAPTTTKELSSKPPLADRKTMFAMQNPSLVKSTYEGLGKAADYGQKERDLGEDRRSDQVREASTEGIRQWIDSYGSINQAGADLVRNALDAGDVGLAKEMQRQMLDWDEKMRREKVAAGQGAAAMVAKESARKDLPLYRQFTQSEKEKIENTNKSFNLIQSVKNEVNGLDPGKLSGFVRALQSGNEALISPELKKLSSLYTMLSQSLTKQIQGSRPSDYDAKIFEKATGKGAIGKENMIAALDAIAETAFMDANNFARTVAKGYDVDIEKVQNLYDNNVWKYGQENEGAGDRPRNLTDEEWEELQLLESKYGQ